MMTIGLGVLTIFALLAFSNWRLGFFLTAAMAFLQDPLRKLTNGEPAIYIVFCAIVFGAATLGLVLRGASPLPFSINLWRRHLGAIFVLFIGVLCFQAANSLVNFGHPLVPALGFANYLAPFVAITVAYRFAIDGGLRRLRQFFLFYLALAAVGFATVLLEWNGFAWTILGEVGVGIHISAFGGLEAYSGSFRAAEIAAWHVATASCLIILLITADRPTAAKVLLAIAIVAVMASIGVLTGRRKFIVVIVVFVLAYLSLQSIFLRRARTPALAVLLIGAIAYNGGYLDFREISREDIKIANEYDLYIERTKTAFGEIDDRGYELGLMPIGWAYNRFGLMGAGLGAGTQGAGHIVDLGGAVGGASEGGLGRLMIELGAPGLVTALFMVMALAAMFWEVFSATAAQSARVFRYACGLVAIIVSNIAHFTVATQAFGDFFVLILLGIFAGAAIAMPVIGRSGFRRRDFALPHGSSLSGIRRRHV